MYHSKCKKNYLRKMSIIKNISLSRNTITRRVENIRGDLMTQLHIKAKSCYKTVNFISSHGLKHRKVIEFLNEIVSEYAYHNQVQCGLRRGRVLKRFFDLHREIQLYTTEKKTN